MLSALQWYVRWHFLVLPFNIVIGNLQVAAAGN